MKQPRASGARPRKSSSRSVRTTRSDAAGPQAPAPVPLAALVLALLVAATVAALLIAQHLKHENPLINASGVVWHPDGQFDPQVMPARFSFVPSYDDRVTVSILADLTGKVVDVIARNEAIKAYQRTPTWRWPGTTTGGAPPPSGSYSVQVHFDRLGRTTPIPEIVFHVREPSS
jgi:hypothetical protein